MFSFPEPNSFYAESAQKLYSLIATYSIMILVIIAVLLISVIIENHNSYSIRTNSAENWTLECFFIAFPFLIILALVYPSFSLLYSLNEIHESEVIVKIIGHQWYWSYEVTGFYYLV